MKFIIVLSAVAAVAFAKPGHLLLEPAHHVTHVAAPLVYSAPHVAVKLLPGAPIGHDGRVVDTAEVAHAKAAHEAAHVHEKQTLAKEAAKTADQYSHDSHNSHEAAPVLIATSHHAHPYASLPVSSYHAVAPVAYVKHVPAAPLGHDGRVVDTPEVAHAKAAHVAAHENEKIALAHEEARSEHAPAHDDHHDHVVYVPQYYSSHHSHSPVANAW